MISGIITLLGTVLALVLRLIGPQKSQGEIERDKLKAIHDADQKFEESGDTTDMGKLP